MSRPTRFSALAALRVSVGLSALGGFATGSVAQAESAPASGRACSTSEAGWLEPDAAQLRHLGDAVQAELWLSQKILPGFTLAEAPEFFASADEVFFDAEENLFIYAYRSAVTGKWVAWVAFDAERTGVVHTSAIALDR